jgi:hypothetical protein
MASGMAYAALGGDRVVSHDSVYLGFAGTMLHAPANCSGTDADTEIRISTEMSMAVSGSTRVPRCTPARGEKS